MITSIERRKIMKRKSNLLIVSSCLLLGLSGLVGCGTGEPVVETYTVSFETNGGNIISPMVYSGEALDLPTPQKAGNIFDGWYDNVDLTGTSVVSPYTPTEDITLYASWEEASTVYLYYGENSKTLEYRIGDTVKKSDFPEVTSAIIDGTECPFLNWTFADSTVVPDEFVASESEYIITATFDESVIPNKYNFTEADGVYTSTGKVAYNVVNASEMQGIIEGDVGIAKDGGGAVGLIFMSSEMPDIDYPFESGCHYITAQIGSAGKLQVAKIDSGFSQLPGSQVALTAMPTAFQEKFNNSVGVTTYHMAVHIKSDKFEVYVDGELCYTLEGDNFTALSSYTGLGYGFRSTQKGATVGALEYTAPYTVSFETNGGSEIAPIKYVSGALDVINPTKEGMVFAGWYYDVDLTEVVDVSAPIFTGDTTLYAKWEVAEKSTVTLYYGDGYAESTVLTYDLGATVKLSDFPEVGPQNDNIYTLKFLGWAFYDGTNYTMITEDFAADSAEITIVAVYDQSTLGKRVNLERVENGFKITGNVDYEYAKATDQMGIYKANITLENVKGGAVGIAFRQSLSEGDYSYQKGNYVSAQLDPNAGYLQVCAVVDDTFKQLKGSKTTITNLPAAYQAKFNAYKDGGYADKVTYLMEVHDKGSSFEVYLDGDLAYESANPMSPEVNNAIVYDSSIFTGYGYGIRASSGAKGSIMTDFEYIAPFIVTLETNGGNEVASVKYVSGALEVEDPTKDGYTFEGRYKDAALTEKVDLSNPGITGDTTLYANWTPIE
jgi:uncharacterized repeat protein (TIGR02543 family)